MNDDYLWDGSGEPDPEIQRLEQVLTHYRYRAKPPDLKLTRQLRWPRRGSVKVVAAAAAVILIVFASMWMFKVRQKTPTNGREATAGGDVAVESAGPRGEIGPEKAQVAAGTGTTAVRRPGQRTYYKTSSRTKPVLESKSSAGSTFVAQRQPITIPFIDRETARHLERAQVMLRSFRNTPDSDGRADSDLTYESRQSRELLYRNILLRRDAEAKGNLPAENLLGTLEPFLLDIANLADRPRADEVRSIKERMQKTEIVSVLQIYSAPILSQTF